MTLDKMLEQILNKKIIETSRRDSDGITLREEYENSSYMEVEVVALSTRVTAIRTGECSHSSALGDGPWRKMCDYLLIFKSNCSIHVVFIELKRNLTSERKKVAIEQLRRSLPFLEYLLSVCKIENSSINKMRLITKYVVIAKKLKKIAKEPVKRSSNQTIVKEQYKGIDITMFGTTRLTLADLMNN